MMPKASSVFQATGRGSTVTFFIAGYSSAKARRGLPRSGLAISLPSGVLRKNRQFGVRDPQNESRESSVALARLHRLRASASDYRDEHRATLCLPEFARAENARSSVPRS